MSGITKAVSLRTHIIWLNQLRVLMNFLLSIASSYFTSKNEEKWNRS